MTSDQRELVRKARDKAVRKRCHLTSDGKADIYCKAIGTNSWPCRYRARPGSQYCGQHQGRTG